MRIRKFIKLNAIFFEMFKSEEQAIIKTSDLNNTNEHLSLQIKVLPATITFPGLISGESPYEQIILPLYIVKLCHGATPELPSSSA